MKKLFSLIVMLLAATALAEAKGGKTPQYEIEGVETGVQGTYLVKVTILSKKPSVSTEQIKYAAVHGVIFKGFSGKGFASQKALVSPDAEARKSDFFDAFWTGGDYLDFANVVDPVADRVKAGKEYRISAIVSVSKDALRKSLEDAGIIKRLDAGF